MKKLIVNADDLGASPAVNRAIMAGAAAGRVTAVSLMVNMPFAEEAAAEIRARCPGLSVALHFCLTSGPAVLPPRSISRLVDDRGCFKHGFLGLWRELASKQSGAEFLAQAKAEFVAQLERMDRFAEKHSLRFDHLDSHQHIHVLPGLLDMLTREADRRGLVLRIPRERFSNCDRVVRRLASWLPGGVVKKMILDRHLRRAEQRVGYFGILDTGKVGLDAFRVIARAIRNDRSVREVFELNIHPSLSENEVAEASRDAKDNASGFSQADLAFYRSPWREREFELVTGEEFSGILAENGITLASFADVTT